MSDIERDYEGTARTVARSWPDAASKSIGYATRPRPRSKVDGTPKHNWAVEDRGMLIAGLAAAARELERIGQTRAASAARTTLSTHGGQSDDHGGPHE